MFSQYSRLWPSIELFPLLQHSEMSQLSAPLTKHTAAAVKTVTGPDVAVERIGCDTSAKSVFYITLFRLTLTFKLLPWPRNHSCTITHWSLYHNPASCLHICYPIKHQHSYTVYPPPANSHSFKWSVQFFHVFDHCLSAFVTFNWFAGSAQEPFVYCPEERSGIDWHIVCVRPVLWIWRALNSNQ